MTPSEQAAAARQAAGLFRQRERGLVVVEGRDRVRWLDGMVSNDITRLAPGPERSGCYATLLTRIGRIVADLHVLCLPEALWLETEADAVVRVIETMERFIVADDVTLRDASPEWERLGLEGPAAPAVLERACGAPLRLSPECWAEVRIGDATVLAAAWAWSGAPGFQLFAPAGAGDGVAAALLAAGAGDGLVDAGSEALEILRIEAGVPRLGSELDEEVLPAEARLERAISTTKGCYTGQEIVARLASRGQVSHLLVGLRFTEAEGAHPARVGAEIAHGGRTIGELTSACVSPAAGAIGLGYVRLPHDEPGTVVEVEGREAEIAPLPFPEAGLG